MSGSTQHHTMDPQNKKANQVFEEYKRELLRSSMDTIRVANPSDQDYFVDWDGFKHKVPAKGEASLPRYIAKKYVQEMKDQIINRSADEEIEKIKGNLMKQGNADPIYNANLQLSRAPDRFSTSNEALIAKIYPTLWLGVESKYGLDSVPAEATQGYDSRPNEDKVLAGLDKPYVAGDTYPINKAKQENEVKDVSA